MLSHEQPHIKPKTKKQQALAAILWALTWPYYRSLVHRTIGPVTYIRHKRSKQEVLAVLKAWIQGKREEFRYVAAAATVSAVGGVSVFSWPSIDNTLWYAKALWYTSLMLAIWALIAAAQENLILDEMQVQYDLVATEPAPTPSTSQAASPKLPSEDVVNKQHSQADELVSTPSVVHTDFQALLRFVMHRAQQDQEPWHEAPIRDQSCTGITMPLTGHFEQELGKWKPSYGALFLWQLPLMAMAWSWMMFITALSLHALRPIFIRAPWDAEYKVAAFYLAFLVPSIALFFWSAAYPHLHDTQAQRLAKQSERPKLKEKKKTLSSSEPV